MTPPGHLTSFHAILVVKFGGRLQFMYRLYHASLTPLTPWPCEPQVEKPFANLMPMLLFPRRGR